MRFPLHRFSFCDAFDEAPRPCVATRSYATKSAVGRSPIDAPSTRNARSSSGPSRRVDVVQQHAASARLGAVARRPATHRRSASCARCGVSCDRPADRRAQCVWLRRSADARDGAAHAESKSFDRGASAWPTSCAERSDARLSANDRVHALAHNPSRTRTVRRSALRNSPLMRLLQGAWALETISSTLDVRAGCVSKPTQTMPGHPVATRGCVALQRFTHVSAGRLFHALSWGPSRRTSNRASIEHPTLVARGTRS